VFVCIRSVSSAALWRKCCGEVAHRTRSFYSRHCSSTASAGPCYRQAQRQRPKGTVIDRSEREGRVAEGLFRAALEDARSGGRRWLGTRIEGLE
jgi:hypothetical protein